MRVLFADQYSDWGGAQFMLRDTMLEGLRRGWHIEFIAPGHRGLFGLCKGMGVRAHHMEFGTYTNGAKTFSDVVRYPRDTARAAAKIRDVVLRSHIDLVVANGPRILPAAATAPCPVVFHLHNRLHALYTRTIVQLSLKLSGGMAICSSNFVAEPLRALVNPASLRILLNGVEDCGFAGVRMGGGPPTVTILGRVAPEKGHLDFLRAAEIVTQTRPDVRFAVVGASSFSDPAFQHRVHAAANNPAISFHGWTGDIARVLHRTSILVVPSTGVDATPRVIMEAFSAGTPVIAYPSGGIPEVIRNGDTGLLTSHPNAVSLAASIEMLLSRPALAAQLALNGRREWESRFRIERYQREMCDLLELSAKLSVEQRGKSQSAAAVACKNDLA